MRLVEPRRLPGALRSIVSPVPDRNQVHGPIRRVRMISAGKKLGGQESCEAGWVETDDRQLLSINKSLAKEMVGRTRATSKWKSFLSRFRSYSVTRRRPTFFVVTFGSAKRPASRGTSRRQEDKLIDKDRIKGRETVDRDCRPILHALSRQARASGQMSS
jgi:hypothetical protein